MAKKPRPEPKKKIIIIAVAAAAVVGVCLGLFFWQNSRKNAGPLSSPRSEKACHTIPAEVSSIGTYDLPCVVAVTTMQYGRAVDEAGERARVEAAIASFDASISPTSMPDIGVYYLDVAPGTENAIITHLREQPGISSASRQGACNYECVGPN